jgi:hypothetical protein
LASIESNCINRTGNEFNHEETTKNPVILRIGATQDQQTKAHFYTTKNQIINLKNQVFLANYTCDFF